MGSGIMTPPLEPGSPVDGEVRKRVCKACDRCRLKKSKCDGSTPCSRCKADNAICVFGERKKSHDKVYPKGYVEMLENQQSQLVTGLHELYRRLRAGEGWKGEPLKETSRGKPLTHDILEHIGALKQDGCGSAEPFEENLELLQRRLFANGAGFLPQESSFSTVSDADHSPITEHAAPPKFPRFTSPFTNSTFPPTPPSVSPHAQAAKVGSPLKMQYSAMPTHCYNQEPWQGLADMGDGTEFNALSYDMAMTDAAFDTAIFQSPAYVNGMDIAINPCMTMKNWQIQDDPQQQYFQASVYS